MPRNPRRAHNGLRTALAVMVGLLCLPAATHAQELAGSPLAVGAPAQITYANGQDVLLRAAPGYDQAVLSGYPEGTPVDLIEGPVYASDGSAWYGVVVWGQQGYLAADFLTVNGTAAPAVAETAPAAEAAPVPAAATDGTQELTVAQPAAAPSASPAYATTDLNLRAGPNPGDAILLVIPNGGALATTGETSNGYLGVVYEGQTGWADGAYVGAGAPAPAPDRPGRPLGTAPALATTAPAAGYTGTEEVTAAQPATAPTDAALVGDPAAAPAGTGASVTSLVNLRGGPSEADAVLRVLPAGSAVTVTGAESNGYVPVWYNGTTGWIASGFIGGSGVTTQEAAQPAAAPVTEAPVATGARTTTEAVNVRTEPAIAAEVIGSIPGGVALTPLAGPEGGFYQVSYNGTTGWVSGAYLGETGVTTAGTQPASAYTTDNPEAAEGGGLIWPVPSGSWRIMQGYNGSSHQDHSSTYQYYYSLDLVRADGNTAGQPVLAPAAGTVRWLDPSSGGISIDIGNGHAVAMFHVAVDPGMRDGTPVRPGQVIGHISGAGEPGFAGTPHLHFALWQTSDGGNWSRDAVPFTGAYAIAGRDFPDIGGSNQHRGTEITV